MQLFRSVLLLASSSLLIAGCSQSPSQSTPTMNQVTSTSITATNTPVVIVPGSRTLDTTAFQPNPVTIVKGSTVTWTNNDSITHTSTSDSGAWNSGAMAPGAMFSETFQTAGTFQYHCTIHPNMVGTIVVQ
jgi:plastocyanin